MANTWKKGNFGLAALSDINRSFDELEQHFNDNTDVSEPTYDDIGVTT
jgi:hypothetical protein